MVTWETYISTTPRRLEYWTDISCFHYLHHPLLFLNFSWFPSQGTSNWLRSQRPTFRSGLLNSREGTRSSQRQGGKNQHWKAVRAPTCTRIQERTSPRLLLDHPGQLSWEDALQSHFSPPSATLTKSEFISSTDWAFPTCQALGFLPVLFPDTSLPSL